MARFYVRLTLVHISGLSRHTLGAAAEPVFFLLHGEELIGRSRYFNGALDLLRVDSDVIDWSVDRFIDTNAAQLEVPVSIDWYLDRGDQAPLRVKQEATRVPLPCPPQKSHGQLDVRLPQTGAICKWTYLIARLPTQDDDSVIAQRLHDRQQRGAVIATDEGLITRIVVIRGLYQPVPALELATERRRARAVSGYKSEDGQGRIYVSHDLEGQWTRDTQLIELTAFVNTCNTDVDPSSLRMDWYLEPLAETALSSLEVHHDVLSRHQPLEAQWPTPPWSKASNKFPLIDAGDYVVSTRVDAEYCSKVQLRCPSLGGARCKVRAIARFDAGLSRPNQCTLFDVHVAPRGQGARYEVGDQTGPMTLWKRADVEYRKMAHALDLPVDQVPAAFEPAFIQLDFMPVQPCTRNLEYLGDPPQSPDQVTRECMEREFGHKATPGHFCVIGVREFLRPPSITSGNGDLQITAVEFELTHFGKYHGTYYDQVQFKLSKPCDPADIEGARFDWKIDGLATNGGWVGIDFTLVDVRKPHGWYTGYLTPRNVVRDLEGLVLNGNNASERQLRLSMTGHQRGTSWHAGGFPLKTGRHVSGATLEMTAMLKGDFTYSGWSPDIVHQGKDYFAGRTLVATHDKDFGTWNHDRTAFQPHPSCVEDMVITLVHELCHGFGLPHECGHWDHRTPRSKSCVLNYSALWMMNDAHQPQPGTANQVGRHLCAFHIRALRHVRLEDNPALMAAWYGGTQ